MDIANKASGHSSDQLLAIGMGMKIGKEASEHLSA
jgi:hypothetical protein